MDARRKVLYFWRMHAYARRQLLGPWKVRINSAPQVYRCEPGWSWSPPPLGDSDLWYVLDGHGTLWLDGRPHVAEAQTCFLLQPGARVVARHDPQRRLRVFAVHFDVVDRAGRRVSSRRMELPVMVHPLREGVFFGAVARQCEQSWRTGGAFGRERAEHLVAQLLLQLYEEQAPCAGRPVDHRVAVALDAAREDPGRNWSVSRLARQAGLSRSQFGRRVVAATGHAPERILIESRIARARQLLMETDLPIRAIAEALGYGDAGYFSRQFGRVAGVTASACRRAGGSPIRRAMATI